MQKIEEWQGVDRAVFENEIVPANRPAVLKGLIHDWPSARAGSESAASVAEYFKKHDKGGTVNAIVGQPETEGRFFYTSDYQGFNFEPKAVPLATALNTFLTLADDPEAPAIALQAMAVSNTLPSFSNDNAMPLLDPSVEPRVWISNRSMIATHFDNNHNIACVVGGRRRFTVFPPEQLRNLYVGPLLMTPGGSPVSCVDLRNPDHEKYPKFRDALDAAQQAVLEPGDAVYIPILWWHGVESLDALNILVNYWWSDTLPAHHKPILALVHTMALMSGLPADERDTWKAFFDHFAFQEDGDPAAHLPPDVPDVMGKLSSEDRTRIMAFVAERLKTLSGSSG